MKYQEILDKLEEMHDESAKEFLGSNEADLDFKENVARWIEGLVKESDSLPCVSDSDCCHQSIMYINSKWKFFCVECGQTGIESDR